MKNRQNFTEMRNNLSIGNTQFRQNFILELPEAWVSANPTAATCGQTAMLWCVLLHRAK